MSARDSLEAFRDQVIAAAQHPAASWRIEGSSDWSMKPGRLTVWVDLGEVEWDIVYETLNDESDGISLG